MSKRRFDKRFGFWPAELFEQRRLYRARIHTDANWNFFRTRSFDDFTNFIFAADVARINAQTIDARLKGDKRKFVVEVNVGDKRNGNLLFNFGKRARGLFVGNCSPNDFTTGLFKSTNFGDRSRDIGSL